MLINVILIGRFNDAKALRLLKLTKSATILPSLRSGVEYNAPHSALSPQSQEATPRQEKSKSCQRLWYLTGMQLHLNINLRRRGAKRHRLTSSHSSSPTTVPNRPSPCETLRSTSVHVRHETAVLPRTGSIQASRDSK